jgi:hypothetical protein
MDENTNTGLTVEAWAEITIKEWVKKAAALGIAPDHPINAERFVMHIVTSAEGDPSKIEFMYDYYLNFIDWGVGKGVTIYNRDRLIGAGATIRRPKQWFTSVFYTQVKKLSEIIAEKYALRAAYILVNTSAYDAEGTKQSPVKTSGQHTSVDSVTGKKKITFKEFEERRKQHGW